MTPADIITRLTDHERDHGVHKAAVHSWLIEAGFHSDLSPCRVAICIDLMSAWCGSYTLSSTRAVKISSTAPRRIDLLARVVYRAAKRLV